VSLLGVDIGSSSCKAAAFSLSGATLATALHAYETLSPGPSMAEVDPEELLRAAATAIREAALAAAALGDPVEALCVSSHGETFVPVDAAGAPLARGVMNIDNRAVAEARWWEQAVGHERLYRIVGGMAHPMYPMPKIRWLRSHRADTVASAARFLGPAELVLQRMGLPPLTDYSLASRWLAFDITKRRWSDELLDLAGLAAGQLPEPVQAGTRVGRLSEEAARTLGLSPGTTVAVGGHDQPCSSLGAGAIMPGVVSDSAGTYECLSCASPDPRLGPLSLKASLNSYCHVVPDTYVTLAFFPSGIVVRWFLDKLAAAEAARAGAAGVDPHEWFETRAPAGPTGLCVTPHLIGACNPYWNPRATTAVIGLTPDSDLFGLYKGIIEGIACEFAVNADVLQEATAGFDKVRIAGGGAGSALGMRLRASLSGRTLETLGNPESVCLGAAILAGIAAGVYRDARDGVAKAVRVVDALPPDPDLARAYAGQFSRYQRLYPAIAPLFEA